MTDQKIYLRKVRDLGAIFSATFGYIKQNFKPLYGSLLFFAGPFLMVAATVSSYMMGSAFSVSRIMSGRTTSIYGDLITAYLTAMLIMFIGITVYNVIFNRNLLENEKLKAGEPLTIKHSIINFWPDFWRILGNTLLLVVLIVIFTIVIVLVFAGIIALAEGGNDGAAIIMAVLAIILFFVFFLILGPILAFVPMAALFICQRDEISIFAAISKVFYYMKGNFWITWVVSLVGLLTYMVLAMVVQIPVFIVSMLTTFTRLKSTVGYGIEDQSTPLLLVIVTAISTLLSYGVMVVYHLIATYQFTSLEEKKEGAAIIDKINQIQ